MRCEIESSTTRDDVPDAVDRVSLMVQPIVNSAVQTAAASNAAHGLARLYAPRVRLDRRAKATEDENTSSTEDRIALGGPRHASSLIRACGARGTRTPLKLRLRLNAFCLVTTCGAPGASSVVDASQAG